MAIIEIKNSMKQRIIFISKEMLLLVMFYISLFEGLFTNCFVCIKSGWVRRNGLVWLTKTQKDIQHSWIEIINHHYWTQEYEQGEIHCFSYCNREQIVELGKMQFLSHAFFASLLSKLVSANDTWYWHEQKPHTKVGLQKEWISRNCFYC